MSQFRNSPKRQTCERCGSRFYEYHLCATSEEIAEMEALAEQGLPQHPVETSGISLRPQSRVLLRCDCDKQPDADEVDAMFCNTCGQELEIRAPDTQVAPSEEPFCDCELPGTRFIGGHEHAPDCAITKWAAQVAPSPPPRPTDDHLWDQTLRERDEAVDAADDLANAIAQHLGVEIGEHSTTMHIGAGVSHNSPWQNALEALRAIPSPPVAPDSLVARHEQSMAALRFLRSCGGEFSAIAEYIEQLQRDNTELLRETTVTAYRKLESRLERVTQAAATLVAWANKDSSQGSPDHCHSVPGIWDNDSGNARVGKAGKPCAECAMWDNARDAIRAEKDS